MKLPARVGLITLACRDVERMAQLFRDLSWPETPGEPEQAPWGGGFSWRDPEGNIWDVAFAQGTSFDERGGVRFP